MLSKKLSKESPVIPFILLILSLAVWTEMDLFVPSLPDAMRYFETTEQVIQWTFSFNFFGFFFSSLFCGALSDALGRRVVLLSGTALFVLGACLTSLSSSIEPFLLGRFIQGLGVGAPAVITMAILADLYQGALFIRWLSILNCLVTLTMALAPIAGAYLNWHFGWRSNFLLIAILAVIGWLVNWLFLPETLPKEYRKPFKPSLIVGNYRRLLTTRAFAMPMIGISALAAPYFIFVSVASLLFINEMGLPLGKYVFCQAAIVGVFSVFSLFISWWGHLIDLHRWTKMSVWICLVCAIVLLSLGLFWADNPYMLTTWMCLFAAGMVIPCVVLYTSAVGVYPDLQASSGALFQSMRMLMLSFGTSIAGAAYNGFYAPIGVISASYVLFGTLLVIPFLRVRKNVEELS